MHDRLLRVLKNQREVDSVWSNKKDNGFSRYNNDTDSTLNLFWLLWVCVLHGDTV
jgi:hypothetical protein